MWKDGWHAKHLEHYLKQKQRKRDNSKEIYIVRATLRCQITLLAYQAYQREGV